ncbi:hypothetical protein O9G_002158 [Rozella allomycis CSF55]|uniref:Uncharacterized protein n=1 Tax=Rozella allomycis (strain CSF55) TaxID=988480 RepID=A0A075AUB3_ROZAC|nr:hypothetical protein O9G_002158 [Rozella allomycis CSF55]|eukprot:EPZ32317.1 hypothetical protein O9G_002158 [Rozella allomycis CSF55]
MGCGGVKYLNGVIIWYLAFIGYYALQYVKLYALMKYAYPTSGRAVKSIIIFINVFYGAMVIGYAATSVILPDCMIHYEGTNYDSAGLAVIETGIVVFNILVYIKLRKYKGNRWLKMQKKFLQSSMTAALYFIISGIIIAVVKDAEKVFAKFNDRGIVSQTLYMTQMVCVGYYTTYNTNCIMKAASLDPNSSKSAEKDVLKKNKIEATKATAKSINHAEMNAQEQ